MYCSDDSKGDSESIGYSVSGAHGGLPEAIIQVE